MPYHISCLKLIRNGENLSVTVSLRHWLVCYNIDFIMKFSLKIYVRYLEAQICCTSHSSTCSAVTTTLRLI